VFQFLTVGFGVWLFGVDECSVCPLPDFCVISAQDLQDLEVGAPVRPSVRFQFGALREKPQLLCS
jgi:hypothetical protein